MAIRELIGNIWTVEQTKIGDDSWDFIELDNNNVFQIFDIFIWL